MQRCILVILFNLFICLVFGQAIKGKVVRVADGDTITLLDPTNTQLRIQLYGIDCPENGQDFANVAKWLTSDLCFSENTILNTSKITQNEY